MPQPLASGFVLLTISVAAAACSRQDEALQQHQEKLESLTASTTAIANAWLAGSTSGTYTSTALERTFALVEQERASLASAPRMLVDSRGAGMSQSAERLSRLLAAMQHDVRGSDPRSLRQRVSDLSNLRSEPR
jgi:hypothetical protein